MGVVFNVSACRIPSEGDVAVIIRLPLASGVRRRRSGVRGVVGDRYAAVRLARVGVASVLFLRKGYVARSSNAASVTNGYYVRIEWVFV